MLRSILSRLSRGAILRRYPALLAVSAGLAAGCTSFPQWVHNGFKVGPNFEEPSAATTSDWIDSGDSRIAGETPQGDDWWNVFRDPAIPDLIDKAYRENLDLKTALLMCDDPSRAPFSTSKSPSRTGSLLPAASHVSSLPRQTLTSCPTRLSCW